MVEELFQGGVCGGTWRNPTLFSGGGGGGSTLCSVAQLGGGCYDISGFGWSHEIMKSSRFNNNDTLLCDNNIDNNNNDKNYIYNNNNNNNNNNNINNLVFSADFDYSTFDILGFGISPTTSTIDWNKKNPFCKSGNSKESYDDRSIFHGSLNSKSNYEDLGPNIQKLIDSTKFPNQNESQYTTMTTSSNNSAGDNSSSISYEGGMATNFQINSSTSYLIQTLFDDNVDNEPLVSIPQPISRLIDPINDFAGSMDRHQVSNCSWDKSCDNNSILLVQSSNSDYNTATISSDIRAAFNLKSLTCADNRSTKLKHEETRHESMKNSNNDQPTAKRARIETPSSLPTFKVRKEKLGDRITALQQLVSPFGKTDTASVLHEAIEYIKFLHDQVHVLSTPYLKNGEMFVEHRQVSDDNEELDNKDLRSRGLCLVPISSTYPVTHETPIDFWTPKFG